MDRVRKDWRGDEGSKEGMMEEAGVLVEDGLCLLRDFPLVSGPLARCPWHPVL